MTIKEADELKRYLNLFVQKGELSKATPIFKRHLIEVLNEKVEPPEHFKESDFADDLKMVMTIGFELFGYENFRRIFIDCSVEFCRGHPERRVIIFERIKKVEDEAGKKS